MLSTDFQTGVIRPVEVYREAWAALKDQYWLIFAIILVGMIVGGAVPVVLIGPALCGIYLCLFEKVEGRDVRFELLFKGFDFFMPSLVVAIVVMAPIVILIFTIYVPMIGMAIAGSHMNERELWSFIIGAGILELFIALFMVCLHTLLMFAFPLIVDRKLSGVEAIKTSAKAVWQNLGGVLGLVGMGFVVAIAGYLMLCIGIYFVMPLIFMSNAVAFRKIFPPLGSMSLRPPPTAYPGI